MPTEPDPAQSTRRCEHNTIPCSRWFRAGWLCVRCGEWFKFRPEGWDR